MKLLTTTLAIFLFFAAASLPAIVIAVGETPATPQGQISEDTFTAEVGDDGTLLKGFVPCSGNGCSACDFVVMANTIIKWLIGICFLFFAVLAVIAGFKLVTGGTPSDLNAAKQSFTNAFIGLIIIFAAWLVVDTLMKKLLTNPDDVYSGYGPWSEIKCGSQATSDNKEGVIEGDADFVLAGGDSDIDSSGITITPGSRCPVPAASSMVSIPTQYTGGRAIKIRSDVLENIKRMYADAKGDGITLTIISGWRSEEMQVALWNKYNGKSAVAKPCSLSNNAGGSNHNSGTAVDIAIGCAKTNSSCSSPAYRWMKDNGATYGFKNSLPKDTVHWSPSGK